MANDKKIKGLYGSFIFVGEAMIFGDKAYMNATSDSGYTYSKMKFGVKTKDGNIVFTELMGGYSTVKDNYVYSFGKNKDIGQMKIDWADRKDAKILEDVADFKKLKFNFEGTDENEGVSLIAEYDAVEYIHDNLKKGTRIFVYGDVVVERYKGKDGKMITNTKYIPKKIRLAGEDEVNKAELTLNFVFDNEVLDLDALMSEGRIDVQGYVTTYMKEVKQNIFVPASYIIDFNHLKEQMPEIHPETGDAIDKDKMIETMKMVYQNFFKVDGDDIMLTQWKAELVTGTTQSEVSDEDFTEEQKMLIELGMLTKEQARKDLRTRGGDRINEIRLIRPTNRLENDEGDKKINLGTDYTEEDFFIPEPQVESKEKVYEGTNKEESGDKNANMIKGIFG